MKTLRKGRMEVGEDGGGWNVKEGEWTVRGEQRTAEMRKKLNKMKTLRKE